MAGILIPISAAALPVFRGSRITVQEALSNYGVSQKNFGQGRFESFLARLRIFGDLFTLSLRNIFRKRSRLVLTLGLLAAGGALFMTALNISKAWDKSLQKIDKYRHYDLEVRLNEAFPSGDLLSRVRNIPGVKGVEAWENSPTSFMKEARYDIVHSYPDKGHGSFVMLAVPPATQMVNFPMLDGRWLDSDNVNEVVLNHMALAQAPHYKVADLVSLSIDGRLSEWKIIGFVEDLGSPATAYVSSSAYARFSNTEGLTNMLRVSLSTRDRDTILNKTREIEEVIEKEGASISMTMPLSLLRSAIAEHMGVLVRSLLAMAFLMAAVGVLGLMSTMSMNIFERTRELGVMRAIGATPQAIGQLVVIEGLIVGVLSLVFAFIFSLLLSAFIGNLIGNMSFRTPLPLSIAPLAFLIWTGLVFLGSILATTYPAWRAGRITTREALSYQ
jgi:putative ABC transport system permease protein